MSQKDWPGSVLSKTPVTPASGTLATNAASGIWSMTDVAYWVKQGNWPDPLNAPDPYFDYVSLLLTGNGTNGAQNNTFLDSSTAAQTMTRVNNPTQGTWSPYGTLFSNYFSGSGDWLTSSGNCTLSGNFTVEAWVYPTSWGSYQRVISGGASSFYWSLGFSTTWGGGLKINWYDGTDYYSTAYSGSPLNTWYHLAVVRTGTTIYYYINGVQYGTSTYSATPGNSSGGYMVGNRVGATEPWFGYISNVRVVSGTNVYGTGSTITVPTTPLTAVSGTSLLTCQSSRFIDNSGNNYTINTSGSPSIQRFSPFNPTAAYDSATISGSGYFDGGGDAVGTTGSISLGTGDFTAEAWWYPMVGPLQEACYIAVGNASQSSGFCLVSDNARGLFVYSAGYVTAGYGFTPKLYAWNHVAVTRSGGTLRTYLNGSVCETASYGNNVSGAAYVGRTANGYFTNTNGYIAGSRVLNTALYTGSTYTIPATPFTNNANTQFLCNFTNAGIPDAAMINDLETVGNAQVSTSIKKYGTGSLYFDGGATSYLDFGTPASANSVFGTGDFTVEMWLYATSLSNAPTIVTFGNFGSGDGFFLDIESSYIKVRADGGTAVASSSPITTSTWYYVAVTRSGGTLRLFIDGSVVGSATWTTNCTAGLLRIAQPKDTQSTSYALNGYIDDLRITRGYARYTSTFTPPAASLPTY